MDADFQSCLSLVLHSEGGFANNRLDPGGATNFGITQRVFDAYRRLHRLLPISVRYISTTDVATIYRGQYWDAVQGDQLWPGLDYCLFDEAVNSGPKKSIIDLQVALGVTADGVFGMVTLAALHGVNDRAALLNKICDLRLNWLHRLATWRVFGRGWSARVAFVRANALKLAAG